MNKEEAKRVINILLQCDGGCEYCVSDLLKLFCKEFSDYEQFAKNAFKEKFSKELNFELEEP